MSKPNSIMIDDVRYVREDSINTEKVDLSKIVLIRSFASGVHFGTLKEHDRKNNIVVLTDSKRLHAWAGACSLSQVAIDGVDLGGSRISIAVPEILIARVDEIIPMSVKAAKQMLEAKEWKR